MRINNGFLNGLSAPVLPLPTNKARGRGGPRKTIRAHASDLARLLARAGEEPEVRSELVDQARERRAAGFYDSAAAVALTAAAMLREDF